MRDKFTLWYKDIKIHIILARKKGSMPISIVQKYGNYCPSYWPIFFAICWKLISDCVLVMESLLCIIASICYVPLQNIFQDFLSSFKHKLSKRNISNDQIIWLKFISPPCMSIAIYRNCAQYQTHLMF